MGDIKAPTPWRRPRSKIYEYNRQFGGMYYQPMIEYMNTKERQGPFFERPSERIHFKDQVELNSEALYCGSDFVGGPNVSKFLIQAKAQQIKEQNTATVKTRSMLVKGVTSMKHPSHTPQDNQQTHFDDIRLLKGEPPGRRQINFYTRELGALKVSQDWQQYCIENHMKDVAAGYFDCESGNYGQGGTPSDQLFYDAELIKNVANSIKFKNPERTIPVV